MLEKIQDGVFDYITNLLTDYGIRSEFKYDQNLDVLNEFRRSIKLRIENKNSVKEYEDKVAIGSDYNTLGLFNRTPLRRSQYFGNNMDLEVFCKSYTDATKIELRDAFFGEVDFNVKLLFDSHEMSDIFELIYVNKLSGKAKTFKVDYNLGSDIEPLEDVSYGIKFSEIVDLGALNTSNLRYMDFSITLEGLVFLPFYQEGALLDQINLEVHVFDHKTDPTPENSSEDTLVHERTFVMNHN